MKLLWYIVGAVALYGLVVYLSTLQANKESFENNDNQISGDDIPSLIIKLNETVSALQKVTNGLSKKLLPSTGVTNNNMKAESFLNEVEKEADAAAKVANETMKSEDGHHAPTAPEGEDASEEEDSDIEPPAAQQQAMDNKSAVEKFVNGGIYGGKKRRTVETFENKGSQSGSEYRGMESYLTFNASSW